MQSNDDPAQASTPTAAAAREAVDMALGFDRSATRLLCLAQATASAHHALDAQLGAFGFPLPSTSWVPLRDGAQAFAINYQAVCRENLLKALDMLSCFADAATPLAGAQATPADVVIAEADAIAAAAESELAAERHAVAMAAAQDAEHAVAAAALTVARAAESARLAREESNRLAAENVAATAARAASDVQTRAQDLASAVSAAALSDLSPATLGGEAAAQRRVAKVTAAAATRAEETFHAASIVALAVESAAFEVAVLNNLAEEAMRQDVEYAARAVRSAAEAAARDVAAATARADEAMASRCTVFVDNSIPT